MSKFYQAIKSNSPAIFLSLLLILTFCFRAFRLSNPSNYIFDEVYHVPTIKAIANNNSDAYNPFGKSPEPNTAYDWLHPPLAKLIQAASVNLLGDSSFSWRLPSAVFGTLSIAALYFFSLTLFKSSSLALLAATIFSLDNLQLTMSRITMNDIFVTTWIILALTFFYKAIKGDSFTHVKVSPYRIARKHLLFTAIFTGLSLATKHSSIFLYPIFFIFLTKSFKRSNLAKFFKSILILALLPITIYLLSYSQMFLQGSTLTDFFNLHKQIYWYQTGLTATHSFQSTAWQWPLLIRPVWFHVKYLSSSIANIYNLGNPLIFWAGLLAFFYALFKKDIFQHIKNSTLIKKYLLISYLFLFLPFIFSPRIMFLHHYLPALPFLCLILAAAIYPYRRLTLTFLTLAFITFIFFYPLNTAIPIPKDILNYWFWLPTWR